jgi:hypothetical protein
MPYLRVARSEQRTAPGFSNEYQLKLCFEFACSLMLAACGFFKK